MERDLAWATNQSIGYGKGCSLGYQPKYRLWKGTWSRLPIKLAAIVENGSDAIICKPNKIFHVEAGLSILRLKSVFIEQHWQQ